MVYDIIIIQTAYLIIKKGGGGHMVYVIIGLFFILGIGCLSYSFSKWTTQRRFAFKNKKIAKEKNLSIISTVVGILLIIVAWFIYRT